MSLQRPLLCQGCRPGLVNVKDGAHAAGGECRQGGVFRGSTLSYYRPAALQRWQAGGRTGEQASGRPGRRASALRARNTGTVEALAALPLCRLQFTDKGGCQVGGCSRAPPRQFDDAVQ